MCAVFNLGTINQSSKTGCVKKPDTQKKNKIKRTNKNNKQTNKTKKTDNCFSLSVSQTQTS